MGRGRTLSVWCICVVYLCGVFISCSRERASPKSAILHRHSELSSKLAWGERQRGFTQRETAEVSPLTPALGCGAQGVMSRG